MSKDYQYPNNSIKELAGFYIMAVHRIDLQINDLGLDPEKEWARINQEFKDLEETDSSILEVINISEDVVNNPSHYRQGELEVIDILQDKLSKEEFEGFLKGNILKYTFREGIKNGTEDMKKAAWYTARLIEFRDTQEG